ncbi:hypothetical protein [Gordonia malaquae]|uniref:hypothetical protein n=1 Tax=Gordonia malaquae TaxID=410332 RepID=UPI0030FE49EB
MTAMSASCYAEPLVDTHSATDPAVEFQLRVFRMLQSDDSDGWPSDSRILYGAGAAERRARANVDRLKRRGLINDAVARGGRKITKFLFKPTTVYASVAEDDGGLIFYWKAGKMSIEIDIVPGEGYWWAVNNVAHESYEGDGPNLDIARLKHSLNQFSKEVESANPMWRAQKF